MADAEHLSILKNGVGAWNQWRRNNGEIFPDLSGADLSGMDLRGAHLKHAHLAGADLSKADLTDSHLKGTALKGGLLKGARLIRAYLKNANLSNANLSAADLNGATFSRSDLTDADLSRSSLVHAYFYRANLTRVNFSSANLTKSNFNCAHLYNTDMTGAIFGSTILADVDLSKVHGLGSVKHIGPSTIGLDTFLNSAGKIPGAFLRGAGIPDVFLEYAASLAGAPFEFYSCFISYSSKDDALVQRLYADLQSKGVRCWFAPEDLKIGDKFRVAIDEAIRLHDKLLIVLSEDSVSSQWVEKEVETAFEKERKEKRLVLFPVRLDQAVMEAKFGWAADIRRTRHIGDFREWKNHDYYAKSFERLLRDLKSEKTNFDSD